ncbi:inorganic diphosphatase [alpha proteobacterium HIMB5]|nr:inorganic diphosphatase [alpha proteobacterium HIMB5]
MKKYYLFYLFFIFPFFSISFADNLIDGKKEFIIKGKKNFLYDYEPINLDGSVNAVIEIPTGTNDKWEVSDTGEYIEHEITNSKPRQIKYLSYPFNYGFIPKTKLGLEINGDGDALDILVLGPSIPRGKIIKVQILGMIEIIDDGFTDHKVVAIPKNSNFLNVNSLNNIKKNYPGILEIIEIWFKNYKGTYLEIKNYTGKKKH